MIDSDTDRIEACATCLESITAGSKVAIYNSKLYHESCFVCERCGVQLTGKEFISQAPKDEHTLTSILCNDCYLKKGPKCLVCEITFQPNEEVLVFQGNQYHAQCFQCSSCGKILATFDFVKDELDKRLCISCCNQLHPESEIASRDYASKQCSKCRLSFENEKSFVRYKDMFYHTNCFLCDICLQQLNPDGFYSSQEEELPLDKLGIICEDCHSTHGPKCAACNLVLNSEQEVVQFDAQRYHANCFRCSQCAQLLNKDVFVLNDSSRMCSKCVRNPLKD